MALLSNITRSLLRRLLPAFSQVPALPEQPAVALSAKTLLGRGRRRECHHHPERPELCVKVARHPEQLQAQEPSIVEHYCATMLDRNNISLRHRPRCHGWTTTNRGPGLLVERIVEADGQTSPTLQTYARQGRITLAQFEAMFAELRAWCLDNGVPIEDMGSSNLLVQQREGKLRLVLIDGIGGNKIKLNYLLYRHLRWYARMRTRPRWPRFHLELRREMLILLHIGETTLPHGQRPPAPTSK